VNNQVSYLSLNSGFNWTRPVSSTSLPRPSGSYSTYETEYAEALGMVSSTQVMYTRNVNGLTLEPLGTPATDQSVIPYYSVYFRIAGT